MPASKIHVILLPGYKKARRDIANKVGVKAALALPTVFLLNMPSSFPRPVQESMLDGISQDHYNLVTRALLDASRIELHYDLKPGPVLLVHMSAHKKGRDGVILNMVIGYMLDRPTISTVQVSVNKLGLPNHA